MRGSDEQASQMFSYAVPEHRVCPDLQLRDPPNDQRGAGDAVAALRPHVLGHAPAIDSSGAATARIVSALSMSLPKTP
jgi:hypothetical protein